MSAPTWTWTRVERTLRRARTWVLAYLPDQSTARRPPVRIRTDTAVPGAVLRLAVVVLGLLCASLVVTGPPGWVAVTILLVIIGIAPGTLVTGVLVITGGLVEGLGLVLPQVMALAGVAVLALLVFWLPSLGPSRRRVE